eukprot:6214826-Pleurochrysis_carterae.AAC.4
MEGGQCHRAFYENKLERVAARFRSWSFTTSCRWSSHTSAGQPASKKPWCRSPTENGSDKDSPRA